MGEQLREKADAEGHAREERVAAERRQETLERHKAGERAVALEHVDGAASEGELRARARASYAEGRTRSWMLFGLSAGVLLGILWRRR